MSESRPVPTGREIKLDKKKIIVSKTDMKGVILYGNDYFVEVSGYSEVELIGQPHNIIRHPDMPKAIFYLLWQTISQGKNITAVVKNLAKNGDHYWVVTDFESSRDSMGNITQYIAYRRPVPPQVLEVIEPLYAKILEVEKVHGMRASVEYLNSFLEEKRTNYNAYIAELAAPKGLTARLFAQMKKMFR
ncbi:PAS domain-containing protein [Nitratifractor sp.]|uniref:PAS domain-containing protein n=1 Tax=Nitratifractor sp. TaxID=2268144 RepID=UPI0025E0CA96|nr:PAS domain-containing protein [Nitratifractor sp.]